MLKNTKLAGKSIVTIYGPVEFDEQGISKDLTKEQAKKFAKIEGYELVEETFQEKDEEKETPDKKVDEKSKEIPKEKSVGKEEEPKEKFTRKQLNNKTVAELEEIALEELGLELEEGLKKDKINQILEAQK